MSDPNQVLRELHFPEVMHRLEVNAPYKEVKGGTEWVGPCPVCRTKTNLSCFHYAFNGKFKCFRCRSHGRGAIELTMQVKGLNFQEAVDCLTRSSARDAETDIPNDTP